MDDAVFVIVNRESGKASNYNGLFDNVRNAKLSVRNNTWRPHEGKYAVAEMKLVPTGVMHVINPTTNKWEEVNNG